MDDKLKHKVNVHIMTALCLKLISLLGTNLQPIIDLKLSDYNENSDFFNEPTITIFKNKTGKESELPFSLFGKDSKEIKRLIELTIILTSLIREDASPDDKEYLFIFMASGSHWGKVKRLSPDNFRSSLERELKKQNILADDGTPLVITPSRFRPTLLNQKVLEGESLDVIKAIAMHSSIKVTQEHYFNNKILEPESNIVVSEALNKIFKNQIKPENKDVYKTPLASCKNPFDNVKIQSSETPCTKFNACLTCKSLIITIEDLPKIFVYRKEITESLNFGFGNHPTFGKYYKKLLGIIDEILKKDIYFSEEELKEAERKSSELNDIVIDPLVFRKVV